MCGSNLNHDTLLRKKITYYYNIYKMQKENQGIDQRKIKYPTLNMHYTSRVSNQRVNNSRIALMKYQE